MNNKTITEITTEEVQRAKELQKQSLSSKGQTRSITDINDLVLVHRTNYWPENGIIRTAKSARALGKYEYKEKEILIPSGRDTIHFSLNGEVSQHALGNNWDQMPISIIIPIKAMSEEQKRQIVGGLTVDLYTKGDLELPEGAYVICSEQTHETRDAGKASVIEVPSNEANGIKGYANALIAKLGYKLESVGAYVWGNEEDEKIASEIIQQNWKRIQHSDSQEHYEEQVEPWINYTIAVLKIKLQEEKYEDLSPEGILDQNGLKSLLSSPPENYFSEHSEAIEIIYKKLEEIGLPMSEEIKKEFERGTQGQFQNPAEAEKARRECSEDNTRIALEIILKKRILETLKLTKIREEIGPDISGVEEIILSDLNLAEQYRKVIELRDKPFAQLSPQDQGLVQGFIQKYITQYNDVLVYGRLDKGIMLAKNDSQMGIVPLSQEEEEKVKGLIVGQDEEMMVPIIQEGISDGTLIEYLQRFETIKTQLDDRLTGKSLDKLTVSYQNAGIAQSDLQDAYTTINKTKEEREQTFSHTQSQTNFEGR